MKVLDWLTEEDQPSCRYFALRDLLDRKLDDPEVGEAKQMIGRRGWAADQLSEQLPDGSWVSGENLYGPKYVATNWRLLVLADLGLDKKDPRMSRACKLYMNHMSKKDGGFGSYRGETSHFCVTGNAARALIQAGYSDDPRVQSALRWLVKEQKEDGGWHCWAKQGTLDCWEALGAFAVLPRQKWSRSIKRSVERGAGFYLNRRLHRQGRKYEPWFRLHYPVHYYYDLLVGLDILSSLGYGKDERLRPALRFLEGRRRDDGTWSIDAYHPDLVPGDTYYNYVRKYPKPPRPLVLEKKGGPSKLITLRALRVMKRASAR